jgi:hypothetical protein
MNSLEVFSKAILDIKKAYNYRKEEVFSKNLISFSSNDYLNLSENTSVEKKAIEAIKKYGVGAKSSKFIEGFNEFYVQIAKEMNEMKQTEKKKKEDSRPLTEADFPPLGGKVVLPSKMTVPGDGVNLADRIRTAIKRQEDDALRRRLELEEEEKASKETLVSLSCTPMLRTLRIREVRRNLEQEAQAEEENYAWQVSGEVEPEPEQ